MNKPVKVLLVDDSTVIRAVLKSILSKDAEVEIVAEAANGKVGVDAAKKNQPDVVILDIEMPIMDGLTALPQIVQVSPESKIIMFSTLTGEGADASIKAMSLGAVECLLKPTAAQTQSDALNEEFKGDMLRKVKAIGAAAQREKARKAAAEKQAALPEPAKPITLHKNPHAYKGRPSLLAIGSSTGGPNALFEVCSHLKDLPIPIVITQHMPPTFTELLANHITTKTGVHASEAKEGQPLENGKILVAPGGKHMILVKDGNDVVAKLTDEPPINFCKPAVDPLFDSAVDIYGSRILATILTGMGHDGLKGAQNIVENNGRLIAQDEETCTVWGMPRAVAEAGICEQILPLKQIGPWLRKEITG